MRVDTFNLQLSSSAFACVQHVGAGREYVASKQQLQCANIDTINYKNIKRPQLPIANRNIRVPLLHFVGVAAH